MTSDPPSIESTGGRAFWFEGRDGAKLRGAAWEQPTAERRGTALLLGGRTEFIEKNLAATEELLRRGFTVWTLDWRGQGLSQRALEDRHKGHIQDYRQFLDDLAVFVERHVAPATEPPLVLLAHSMGGHISLRFLQEQPARFAAAAFSSPMVSIGPRGLLRPPAKALAWLGHATMPESYVLKGGPYDESDERFEGNILTSDRARFEQMVAQIRRNPELALGSPTWSWLQASFQSIDRLTAPDYASRIATPVLIASAGEEKIVDNEAQRQLCRHMPKARFETIEGALHELFIEADSYRQRFWALVDEHFAAALP